MNGRSISISMALIFVISAFLLPIHAEEEPNDTMDDPDPLTEEWTNGHVNYRYGDLDVDFYSSPIPQNGVLIITLKKLDVDYYTDIDMAIYDEYHESYSDTYGISLDIPGEEKRAVIYNKQGMDTMFFMVSGDGNYSIKKHALTLSDEGDWPDDDPDRIAMDTESVEGVVYFHSFEGIDIEDIDAFFYGIDDLRSSRLWSRYDNVRINITLEKSDDDAGDMELYYSLESSRWYESRSPSLAVSSSRKESSIEIEDDHSDILSCWIKGVGSYKLTINITNIEEEEEEGDGEEEDEEESSDDDLDLWSDYGIILLLCGACAYPFLCVAFIFIVIKIFDRKKPEKDKVAEGPRKRMTGRKGPVKRHDISGRK